MPTVPPMNLNMGVPSVASDPETDAERPCAGHRSVLQLVAGCIPGRPGQASCFTVRLVGRALGFQFLVFGLVARAVHSVLVHSHLLSRGEQPAGRSVSNTSLRRRFSRGGVPSLRHAVDVHARGGKKRPDTGFRGRASSIFIAAPILLFLGEKRLRRAPAEEQGEANQAEAVVG